MELLTLLALSAVFGAGFCSPLAPPAVPRHAAPEALNLIDLQPQPSPGKTADGQVPAKGCTTTFSEKNAYPCSWDGTTTIYAATTVMFQQINCNGCENVQVLNDYYFCPNQRINGTRWRDTPSTSWSTVCRPSAALAGRVAQREPKITALANFDARQTPVPVPHLHPARTRSPRLIDEAGSKAARNPHEGAQPAACPTTLVVQPTRSAGKTATTYSSFTTTTLKVDCGGCPLVVSTALAGYGPPEPFVATTTLPVGAVTTYGCQ